ncbi:methyltransferase [Hydrogenimonas urashimensis]|uniref:methyltransferase n=1 Tax=Hydrogenimonas urashimensis TaxID=2740515 RepID=UPI001915014D|nr:methyltransferase [Hydrogenimonas urashimensis]
MAAHKEFCRFAGSYGRYSLIQERVARFLASKIKNPYPVVVDLGCGTGGFFRAYEHSFTKYFAIDAAPEMLALHPCGKGVEKIIGNFNDPSLFETLGRLDFDLLVSSSALQWCDNLEWTLSRMARLNRPVAMAVFTSGTFATLHQIAGTSSPISSLEETTAAIAKHFDAKIDLLRYRIYFRDTLSMLRYIKRSGVSGGRGVLGYKETKKILSNYPLAYLEFEVVCAVSKEICRRIDYIN